jgi:hypothetical protein
MLAQDVADGPESMRQLRSQQPRHDTSCNCNQQQKTLYCACKINIFISEMLSENFYSGCTKLKHPRSLKQNLNNLFHYRDAAEA